MTYWFYYLVFVQGSIALLLCVMLSMFARRHMTDIIAFFVSTLVVVFMIWNWNILEEIKGYPLTEVPDKFIIISFIEQKPEIYIWANVENHKHPVTIVIPWTQEDAKKLAENRDKIEGEGLEGRPRRDGLKDGLLEFYEFNDGQEIEKIEF
jgi:hypothetical protein